MDKLEKVIKCADMCLSSDCSDKCPYQINHEGLYSCIECVLRDALELLKEQQGISVNAFQQWCIESHRMGDSTRKGIEYWINEFKASKQKAKDGEQE